MAAKKRFSAARLFWIAAAGLSGGLALFWALFPGLGVFSLPGAGERGFLSGTAFFLVGTVFFLVLWRCALDRLEEARGENLRLRKALAKARDASRSVGKYSRSLSLVMEHLPVGALFLDESTRVCRCNAEAAKLLGISRNTMLGRSLFSGEASLSLKNAYAQGLLHGRGDFYGLLKRGTGDEKYFHCCFLKIEAPLFSRGMFCFVEDMSREYAMRSNLGESERFLNEVLDFLPLGLLFVDEESNLVVRANEYVTNRMGEEKDMFAERPYADLVAVREVPSGEGTGCRREYALLGGDSPIPLERYSTSMEYRGRKLRVETLEDIRGRRKAEQKLQDSLRALGEANALARMGSFILDMETFALKGAPEFFGMMGIVPDTVEHLRDFLAFVHPKERELLLELFRTILEESREGFSPKEHSLEVQLKRPYHSVGWFLLRARRDTSRSRKERVFVTLQDITELRHMEKALRESEEKYRGIFESLQDIYFRCDVQGRILQISPSVRALGDYEPGELLGLDVGIFFTRNFRRAELLEMLRKKNVVSDFELALRDKHGEFRHVSLNCRIVRNGEGRLLGYEGTLRDISERMRSQEALRMSEARFRGIFDSSRDAVGLFQQGLILDCNESFVRVFGYETKNMLAGKECGLLSPEFQPQGVLSEEFAVVLERVAQYPEEEIPIFEWVFHRKNGEEFFAEVQLSPLRMGTLTLVQALVRDVTERKVREDLRRRLSEVVRQSPVSIAVADRKGIIQYTNTCFRAKERVPEAEFRGTSLFEYLRKRKSFTSAMLEEVHASLEQEHLWVGEGEGAFEDGEKMVTSIRLIPLLNASRREVLEIVYMGEDITERKRMEEDLTRARERAESASRSKSLFLANMSHEIRTPMNAILGYAQLLLQEEGLSSRQMEHLETIGHSGEHLLGLINDILEMSKIEAGRITLAPGPGDFGAMLKALERMFALRAREKGLLLSVHMQEGVPRWIEADHDKLRQVLINLLSNAVKFTSRGGISLEARIEAEGEASSEERRIAVDVRDTGAGIAPEELEKVFSSFEQTASGIRHGGGTGLGMAISRKYARLMGGDITVSSTPGKGSCFSLVFSCRPAEKESSGASELPQFAGFDFRDEAPRILVVDDNPVNRHVLVAILEHAGFQTLQAEGGNDALAWFREWHPHMVLMDFRMEDMDGFDATDLLRREPGGENVPVLMVTASVMEEKRVEAMDRGLDGFLRKPFKREELFLEMARHLSLKLRTPELSAGMAEEEPGARSSPEDLGEAFRQELAEATECGDDERMRELIESVKTEHPDLGEMLMGMVDAFNYEGILAMMRGEEKG